MRKFKFIEVNGEKLLDIEQAEALIDEAIEKLSEKYDVAITGYETLSEEDDIVGKEIIITICESVITLQLGGWVEVDRRVNELDGEIEVFIWFSGIITIPELDLKLGGGFNDDYRVIRMDYDYKTKEWSGLYVDSL